MFDVLATSIGAEYDLFLFALQGRLLQMRAPGIEVTPRAIVDFRRDVARLSETFYGATQRLIDAQVVSSTPQRRLEVEALIRGMIQDNVAQVEKLATGGMNGVASLLVGQTGAIGLLAQRQSGHVTYRVRDTSGRAWPAKSLMFTVIRDFTYQTFIDAQVESFLLEGADLVRLSNSLIISLLSTEGHLGFLDSRERIFHPNASTMIASHV